jgi:hypothetical protein
MSAQIDYWTIAVIAGASGFFGAFGSEIARFLIGEFKARKKGIARVLANGK